MAEVEDRLVGCCSSYWGRFEGVEVSGGGCGAVGNGPEGRQAGGLLQQLPEVVAGRG